MKPIAFLLSLLALTLGTSQGFAQNSDGRRLADLEQDVLQLKTEMGRMNLALEQLQRENTALRAQVQQDLKSGAAQYATMTQVNVQLNALRQELAKAQREQKQEIIDEVSRQIENLAQQTQKALQAQAASIAAAPSAPTPAIMFTDSFPKTGISYTVQKGDNLSTIARRNNASVNDIINANRIADPTKLMPGQVLFIPQKGK